jgi:ATP-dependent RNA helicase DeaD
VLAPTRELALQVSAAITQLGRTSHVRVATVYGGAPYGPQITQIRRAHVVVGTPGRILDMIKKKILEIGQVRTLVLDEADEMLSMGFIEDIETILAATPAERQTALFSATLPAPIRRLADRYMRAPRSITIQSEQVTLAAIEQRFYLVNEEDKAAALTRLFEAEEMTQTLIFAGTRAETTELATALSNRGVTAEVLNGDLSQEARERTLNNFRHNLVRVLVATDVAARGLDIDGISHVFNYNLPHDPELYVHRIGRTGRAGKTGVAISLVAPSEKRLLRQVEAFIHQHLTRATLPSETDIITRREGRLMDQVRTWLRRGRCLREREMIDILAAEGFDPLDIAAAALKVARSEEKQRPIAPVAEVRESVRAIRSGRSYNDNYDAPRSQSPRRNREERAAPARQPKPFSDVSHEPGMVRMRLSMGKAHGLRPNEVVAIIASQANIPGRSIGKIHIQQSQSWVDVPEEFAPLVLDKTRNLKIRRQDFELTPA